MGKQQASEFWFPGNSPTELKGDPFLGAKILQHVDARIFTQSERRNRRPWNPWRFLLEVPRLPPAEYDLFGAAESVWRAMNHVQAMLYGGATLPRDLAQNMQDQANKGNYAEAERIAKKLVRNMVKHGLWDENYQAVPDATRRVLDSWESQAHRTI